MGDEFWPASIEFENGRDESFDDFQLSEFLFQTITDLRIILHSKKYISHSNSIQMVKDPGGPLSDPE